MGDRGSPFDWQCGRAVLGGSGHIDGQLQVPGEDQAEQEGDGEGESGPSEERLALHKRCLVCLRSGRHQSDDLSRQG